MSKLWITINSITKYIKNVDNLGGIKQIVAEVMRKSGLWITTKTGNGPPYITTKGFKATPQIYRAYRKKGVMKITKL